ncbi:MAG: hypothetical protein LYZ66_03215 [Nitrososphaerales archaeon]|nr:hypothetical protein [Nitrososphaerales archaeon]
MRSRFQVTDTFQLPDGEVEYKITYGPGSKDSFKALCSELLPKGFSPWLAGSKDDCSLVVRKRQPPRPSVSRIPVIMALLTVASVVVFGLLERSTYAIFAPGIPDYVVVVSSCACILAILAAHELGHRYVAEREHVASPTPFLVPGIPGFTAFLPSLGIVSLQREPAVNRDVVFDLSIVGPIAAFGVTLLLYFVGEFAAVQSVVPLSGNRVVNGYVFTQINPSVIQMAIGSALSGFTSSVAPGYFKLSPINDAAAIGFLLTFLNLLPMTFFDGGYMAASVFGGRGVRVATYLSVLALVTIDTPTYWAPAIIVLLIASRAPRLQVLDEVSEAKRSKKAVLLLALLLAFLCLPFPQNFATFPLG